jgi:hypothetical protein
MNLLKRFVKPIGLSLVGSVAALALSTAQAVPINGSISFSSTSVTISGANLSNSSSLIINFGSANQMAFGSGTDAYATIPSLTPFAPATLDLTNLAGFDPASASNGMFDAQSSEGGFTSQIIQQSPNFLDVFLIGDYSGLPGFDTTLASMRLSFNESGNSVSAAITLNSPPVPPPPIPEPASIALMGLGLAGLGAWRRRKA